MKMSIGYNRTMTIAVYTHEDCLKHDTIRGHPECPARLTAILNELKNAPFKNQIKILDAPLGKEEDILLVHKRSYLEQVKEANPEEGYFYLDGDTIMSPGSYQAALRGVGAACAAMNDIIDKKYKTVFCAARPPGHHATKSRAMGFCLFDNIAVAACHALERKNISRIAIVDFDVHHGNGTQDIFDQDERVLFISTHQSPLYPGTGMADETGAGNILNLPLPAGTNGTAYRKIFTDSVLPRLKQFRPEIILVSAGFDAHRDDPLAGLNLVEDDFAWIGQQLKSFADKHCEGRIASFLEGGYNLQALAGSVAAYLSAFV